MKVRQTGRIVSVAVTVAVAVNDQGRREVLGVAIGASEAETFWTEFLRSLARRGLRGVKLVISDDHKGLKAAATRILGATWQRCRVHFARNLLAHAGRQGRRVVSAFAQEDADSAKVQWRQVADQLRPKVPKLAVLMDEAEHDVLAYMSFPREHRQKLHSTNPIERLHAEVKRRTNVVGIFPNEARPDKAASVAPPRPKGSADTAEPGREVLARDDATHDRRGREHPWRAPLYPVCAHSSPSGCGCKPDRQGSFVYGFLAAYDRALRKAGDIFARRMSSVSNRQPHDNPGSCKVQPPPTTPSGRQSTLTP